MTIYKILFIINEKYPETYAQINIEELSTVFLF